MSRCVKACFSLYLEPLDRAVAVISLCWWMKPLPVRAAPVDSLIQNLADPDPDKRTSAEVDIVKLGLPARQALVQASRDPNPALATAAARVLMRLPFAIETDPPVVKESLVGYGDADEPGRIKVAGDLAALSDHMGIPALLRLIVEDPSEDVCWKIVGILTPVDPDRGPDPTIRDLVVRKMARQLAPPDSRTAAMVLAARAWLWKDRTKTLDLLRRAVELESRHPAYDDSELDFAFGHLCEAAIADGRYDEAARLRRLQCARIGVQQDSYPGPVYELFALHAHFGPLAGLDDDARNYADVIGNAPVLYALSQAYARAGRSLEAMAAEQAAVAITFDRLSRDREMNILLAANFELFARHESYTRTTSVDPELVADRFEAHNTLANLDKHADMDAEAVAHLNAVLSMIPQLSFRDGVEPLQIRDRFEANLAWHTVRLAQAKGDAAAVNTNLDVVMRLPSPEVDVAENTYPLLIAAGRRADAEKLFNTAYTAEQAVVIRDPENPVSWNDLAWLCARCDQKLPEAMDLASKAVAAMPAESSLIDTLAEVNFRMGNAAEAAKLETRALQLQPDDIFMSRQLERFRAGMKKSQ